MALDWDDNRYNESIIQIQSPINDPSTIGMCIFIIYTIKKCLTNIAETTELKAYIKKLNDAFNNKEMATGITTQIIIESFRIRRAYLQLGQTMEQILNEMPFTQHIIFVSVISYSCSYFFSFKGQTRIRTYHQSVIHNRCSTYSNFSR